MEANKACLNIFGVDSSEVVKGFKLFEDPNISDETKEKVLRGETARYQAPFDFEKVKDLQSYQTTKSGIIDLDVLIKPLGVKTRKERFHPKGYLVQLQDITEQKQMEKDVEQATQELLNARAREQRDFPDPPQT